MDNRIYRHGDVLLRRVKKVVKITAGKPELTIARGEATGHHHTLYPIKKIGIEALAQLIEMEGVKYLALSGDMELRHQEHHALKIDQGVYEIIDEQEIDPYMDSIRKVED